MTKEEAEKKLRSVSFIKSGSTLLDLALGGGWALGRVSNLVGDRSSGKTLLAIEAFANFVRSFPKGLMGYGEAESAFDEDYAATLGFPDNVYRPPNQLTTVEEWYDDLNKFIAKCSSAKVPGIYILDTLDALTDEAELKKVKEAAKAREDNESAAGDYGAAKAKKLSQFFRVLNSKVAEADIHLMVISQVRENIGTMSGNHYSRSGGKALDFYASQILWLVETGKISKQSLNQERVLGITVESNTKKCKVGLPHRKVEFPIMFGYGVDDEVSLLDFLNSTGRLISKKAEAKLVDGKQVDIPAVNEFKELTTKLQESRKSQDRVTLAALSLDIQERAKKTWWEIEDKLKPPMSKYS